MDKINFQNGVSGNTPLNATNLNKLQDNIEKALKGTVLFENAAGIQGTGTKATLNDDISKYTRFKVVYNVSKDGASIYSYNHIKEFMVLNDPTAELQYEINGINDIGYYSTFKINGNTLSITRDRVFSAIGSVVEGSPVYYTKIIAYVD